MKNYIKSNLVAVLVLIVATFVYYYKSIVHNLIPFPGDLLTGAYFPWLEYKWGYQVGVPVKNPLISDVFSQFFIWKSLIAESIRAGNWPLWNSYSYSGYPLLANFHSGALNPLNLLLVALGDIQGWKWFVICQSLGAAISMYLLLKIYKRSASSSIAGAITYAFCGFAISWSQFATAGSAMMWIPLLLLSIELFCQRRRTNYLLVSPIIFGMLLSAGHFQATVYTAILGSIYFVYRLWQEKIALTKRLLSLLVITIVSSVTVGAVQILPTMEMMKLSVRFGENYIKAYNYGLLPLRNFITLFAPDYFGNPVTGNFWGFFNYHETIFYVGIVGLVAMLYALFSWNKLTTEKFFVITGIAALLLGFDTPLGKAIYVYNMPGLSTSAAGRIAIIFSLAAAVLVASFIDRVRNEKLITLVAKLGILYIGVGLLVITTYKCRLITGFCSSNNAQEASIAWRNLAIPLITFFVLSVTLLVRKFKLFPILICLLVMLDLFRFGWKYTPFVKTDLVFPETSVLTFLKNQPGIFRIDRERAEVLSPNTWAAYRLMSPSGYDPMAVADYVKSYETNLNGSTGNNLSRYSELDNYDAEKLGNFNVKYLLSVKRDEKSRIPGNNVSWKIDEKEWKRVFETANVAVLENTKVKDRVLSEGKSEIISYKPNRIEINYENSQDGNLILKDSYYPGWRAYVNNTEVEVTRTTNDFRMVKVPGGNGKVVFEYFPKSFRDGLITSAITVVGLGILLLRNRGRSLET